MIIVSLGFRLADCVDDICMYFHASRQRYNTQQTTILSTHDTIQNRSIATPIALKHFKSHCIVIASLHIIDF